MACPTVLSALLDKPAAAPGAVEEFGGASLRRADLVKPAKIRFQGVHGPFEALDGVNARMP